MRENKLAIIWNILCLILFGMASIISIYMLYQAILIADVSNHVLQSFWQLCFLIILAWVVILVYGIILINTRNRYKKQVREMQSTDKQYIRVIENMNQKIKKETLCHQFEEILDQHTAHIYTDALNERKIKFSLIRVTCDTPEILQQMLWKMNFLYKDHILLFHIERCDYVFLFIGEELEDSLELYHTTKTDVVQTKQTFFNAVNI